MKIYPEQIKIEENRITPYEFRIFNFYLLVSFHLKIIINIIITSKLKEVFKSIALFKNRKSCFHFYYASFYLSNSENVYIKKCAQ